jgi:hypothetical protein
VSFIGFMLLGPTVLIVLRIYLQIYVRHSDRLDRLARSMSVMRSPTLIPLQNPLIRCFSALIFYLLLPLTMMLVAWKAAVFPAWGSGLLCVAVGVVVSHVMLLLNALSWRLKVSTTGTAIVVAGIIASFEPVHRPFELFRANLSGQWLFRTDLGGADLSAANLSGTDLSAANLSGADLSAAFLSDANLGGTNLRDANLSGANLSGANLMEAFLSAANLIGANLSAANLSDADLRGANLIDANLIGANLSGTNLSTAYLIRASLNGAILIRANLSGADLSRAENLTQGQLDTACGNASTKLPERDGKRMFIADCPP